MARVTIVIEDTPKGIEVSRKFDPEITVAEIEAGTCSTAQSVAIYLLGTMGLAPIETTTETDKRYQ